MYKVSNNTVTVFTFGYNLHKRIDFLNM